MRLAPKAHAGLVVLLGIAGCSTAPPKDPTTYERITAEMKGATEARIVREQQQKSVVQSLLPPIAPELPSARALESEPRVDVIVTNSQVADVLNALVTDTRYSMIVHPDVKGQITLSLKYVTVPEVFRSICEMRAFECRIEGTRMSVQVAPLQTRMLRVDYLNSERRGSWDVRVSSNAIAPAASSSTPGGGGATPAAPAPSQAGQGAAAQPSLTATRIGTTSTTNFWTELRHTLAVLIGCGVTPQDEVQCAGDQKDHRVVVSPQSGTVLVRAMPDQLRAIAEYLRVSQNSLERQVLIDAKILEVSLKDGFESGVNWAGFFTQGADTVGIGMLNPATRLGTTGSGVLLDNASGRNPLIGGISSATGTTDNSFLTGTAPGAGRRAFTAGRHSGRSALR